MTIDPRVYEICEEFGVEIIPGNKYPEPGQTRAVATLSRILNLYGVDHFRLLMTTTVETDNNRGVLVDCFFWAASDLLLDCRRFWEADFSKWLEVFDKAPVDQWLWRIRSRGKQRYLLQGMLLNRIEEAYSAQPELFEEWRVA